MLLLSVPPAVSRGPVATPAAATIKGFVFFIDSLTFYNAHAREPGSVNNNDGNEGNDGNADTRSR